MNILQWNNIYFGTLLKPQNFHRSYWTTIGWKHKRGKATDGIL